MITKTFISYSFADRNQYKSFDRQLREFLESNFSMKTHSLVFDLKEKVNNKTLMELAFKKINECDLILIELSHKSIGVGIEAGYAKAKGKRIIYMHKIGTELSTTADGICDSRIEYKNISDLLTKLKKILQ
ncbi:MAG: hypothetical protein Q8P29_04520 [Candidatus Levybacteria bacterium]|nr:hypothetical protein [Candidatus Levybacteria bacterium]